MMEEMRRSMDENNRRDDRREDLDHRDYRDRVNEPDFNIPNPVEKFAVEITLDHPTGRVSTKRQEHRSSIPISPAPSTIWMIIPRRQKDCMHWHRT